MHHDIFIKRATGNMSLASLKQHARHLAVLYVEDSTTLRNVMEKKLKTLFATVDTAKDGQEGFERYRAYYEQNDKHYDIVVTDLEMPVADGYRLSRLIFDLDPSQEIIIISGNSEFSKIVDLINIGVHKFIAKPVDDEQLYKVLSDVTQKLRLKRLQEEERQEVLEHNQVLKEREEMHLRRLEESIKELEEFKVALDQSAIVSKTDIEGRITYVNDRFCEISGYRREELLGQRHSLLNSRSLSRSYFARLWNTITAKKSHKALFKNRAKDRSIYFLETIISPILDIDGEIAEFIAVSYDMTQLMESLEKMHEAKKAKEAFFINMSHEMRTPLNAILGFSSLLKSHVKDDERLTKLAETIHESGRGLHHLIEMVLDISRLQDHTLDLVEEPFSPLDVFNNCVDEYAQKAKNRSQAYEASIDPKLPRTLIGDARRITQLLGELLDNAIKFTPEQGKIGITIFYDSERLILQVRDNGIGIAKKDQPTIFDLDQIDNSLDRSYEGAGLGLTLVSGLLKSMRGEISLKSIPGRGSLFKVEIPLQSVSR